MNNKKDDIEFIDLNEPIVASKESVLNPAFETVEKNVDSKEDIDIQSQISFPFAEEPVQTPEELEKTQIFEPVKEEKNNWEYELQSFDEELPQQQYTEKIVEDSNLNLEENKPEIEISPIGEQSEQPSVEATEEVEKSKMEQISTTEESKGNYTFLIVLFILLLGFIIALPYITK